MLNSYTDEHFSENFHIISNRIIPVIKIANEPVESGDKINLKADEDLIYTKIAGNLNCFYGIDYDTHIELIQKKHLPEHVDLSYLDKLANTNLVNKVNDNLRLLKTDFNGYGFSCGGDYESALIKLPEIWNLITKKLSEPIIFCVPAKDTVVFVSAGNEIGVNELKKIISIIHKMGDSLLSKELFCYSNGIIDKY
jgi:uncharacterized protein YtpQ (UPF0354 family)